MIEVIDKPTQRIKLKVIDPIGLHARPASLLCGYASKVKEAEVNIIFNGKQVNAKSIMGILSLGIRQNDEFELWLQGSDAEYIDNEIVDMVEYLIENDIVEEVDTGETIIEEEVEATIKYLKRFPEDEFIEIIAKTIKAYCEIDNLNMEDIISKIVEKL